MIKKFQILIFSNDSNLRNLLFLRLKKRGFIVFSSRNIFDFLELFYKFTVDLIIIDNTNEDIKEILNIIKKIRFINPKIKTILISNVLISSKYLKKVEYIVKPFLLEDFDIKISNIFKLKPNFSTFFSLKEKYIIYIYENLYKIRIDSAIINLTKIEFNLFEFLLLSKNNICDKFSLLKYVLGYDDKWSFESNIIEMHLSKLKKKFYSYTENNIFYKKGKYFYLFNKKIK